MGGELLNFVNEMEKRPSLFMVIRVLKLFSRGGLPLSENKKGEEFLYPHR